MKMMPVFYQSHLRSQLRLEDYLMLEILIHLLQSLKKVKLETLATVFPLPILFESRRKKIQRFLSLTCLTLEIIWFPLITMWLETQLQAEQLVYLAIDRTSWRTVNLLMISLIWNKRAIPIYFELLSTKS